MVNIILAYDDQDGTLGDYFKESKEHIHAVFNEHFENCNIIEIPSNRCNEAYMDLTLPGINTKPFLFVNYSHGSRGAVSSSNNGNYISLTNAHLLQNCFAYFMSCYAGSELGGCLIQNNTLKFIGFDKKVNALRGRFQKLSIACDNYALVLFTQGKDINLSFSLMKEYITKKIDELEEMGEVFAAADLKENRDCLVILGDQMLSCNDFKLAL